MTSWSFNPLTKSTKDSESQNNVSLSETDGFRNGLMLHRRCEGSADNLGPTPVYFNVFVLVVQRFENVPVLRTLAPTQKEPPFLVSPLVVLALFVALTIVAVKRSHGEPVSVAPAIGRAA
jgi:hypothetical protein